MTDAVTGVGGGEGEVGGLGHKGEPSLSDISLPTSSLGIIVGSSSTTTSAGVVLTGAAPKEYGCGMYGLYIGLNSVGAKPMFCERP